MEEPNQRCMGGLPATRELIGLKIPYGAWEPDTLITDTFGNPMFSVLDVQHHAMGSYEAIFGDENGHKLCYVKRRLITVYHKDGWDFCTYKPNFPDQPKYKERDMYGKSVYPFSFLQIRPMKCRYSYSVHEETMDGMETHLEAMHGWLGSMIVCCTPMVRLGKWQLDFHRPGSGDPEINIDQSKNLLEVERGNDLLASLCIAYAFDKALCQPLVTIVGYQEKEHMDDDDDSMDSYESMERGAPVPPPEQYPALMAPPEEEDEPDIAGYLEAPPEEYDDPDIAGYLEAPPEEEEYPEVAGYLEAPPEEEELPEVAGYLEAPPEEEELPEVAGYLEAAPDQQDDPNNAGYLEAGYSDDPNNAGYLENQPYSDDPDNAGYLQNDGYDENNEGYIENQGYNDGQVEPFHDEP